MVHRNSKTLFQLVRPVHVTPKLHRIEIPVGRSRLLDGVQFLQSGDDLGANDVAWEPIKAVVFVFSF